MGHMSTAPGWSPVPSVRLGSGQTVEAANGAHRLAARLLDILVLSPAVAVLAGAIIEFSLQGLAGGIPSRPTAYDPPSDLIPLHDLWALAMLVLYEPLMVARWGATVGKMAAGVRVVRFADGARVSMGRSWGRVALPSAAGVLTFGVGWLVVMGLLGLSATRCRQWRGWHDSLAGTAVVAKASAVSLRPDVWGRGGGRRVRRGDCAPDAMGERWQRFMRGDGEGS